MAKFEILIPFILHAEAALDKKYMSLPYEQMFEKARATGFACDPADSGGATMCGVTLATYTAWRSAHRHASTTVDDLRNISYEEWREIFRLMFWNRWRADEIECQAVANALVDWVWTSGTYGITTPQRSLHLKADGIVGPKTLATVNSYADQHALFDRIQNARNNFFNRIVAANPKNARFLKGWRRRLNKIKWEGFDYE